MNFWEAYQEAKLGKFIRRKCAGPCGYTYYIGRRAYCEDEVIFEASGMMIDPDKRPDCVIFSTCREWKDLSPAHLQYEYESLTQEQLLEEHRRAWDLYIGANKK